MATISQVRDGLKATIGTVTTLRGFDTIPLADVPVPCFYVLPDRGAPRTLGGLRDTQEYRIRFLVSTTSERVAQDTLDGFLSSTGTSSVRAALVASKQLGLTGVTAVYAGWENYGLMEVNGAVYFGADVLITVEN